MIEGLKFHFTGDDIIKHMQARSKHHAKRASEKEADLPKIKEAVEALGRDAAPNQELSKIYSGDPTQHIKRQLAEHEEKIRDHKKKAFTFDILSRHILEGETYVLTETDLARLEVTAGGGF
jgi:hypothetical protein